MVTDSAAEAIDEFVHSFVDPMKKADRKEDWATKYETTNESNESNTRQEH